MLTIIIVNWNGIAFLPACLKSIVDNRPSVPFEIVVVDNDSSDGSAEWLKSDECARLVGDAELILIETGANLGFGKANNIAIERTESKFILLLNPDTQVRPRAIDLLCEALTATPDAGATAPRLLNADGSLQPSTTYYLPTPFKIIVENFRLYKLLPQRFRADNLFSFHWDHDEQKPVPMVWGAAMLFDGDILRALKGFDPDFVMYGEDMDLCARLLERGNSLIFVPASEVVHIGGQSAIQQWSDIEINEKKLKMGILFEKKHSGRALFIANSLTRIGIDGVRLALSPLLGQRAVGAGPRMRLYWQSLFE
jgi:GT2 family glycosyltransferase